MNEITLQHTKVMMGNTVNEKYMRFITIWVFA